MAVPDTAAVKSIPFKGAVPELGLAEREQERVGIGLTVIAVEQLTEQKPVSLRGRSEAT